MNKPHITDAHRCWQHWVRPGDQIIDATVGNGHDTLFLTNLLKGSGHLIGYDLQPIAIERTQKRLQSLPENERSIVSLKCRSHDRFEETEARLVVYNLGYLPGGDKKLTTHWETSVKSIEHALNMVNPHGAISITCYSGHSEGEKEQKAILAFLKTLPSDQWSICYHEWINRPRSPTWIWLQGVPHA